MSHSIWLLKTSLFQNNHYSSRRHPNLRVVISRAFQDWSREMELTSPKSGSNRMTHLISLLYGAPSRFSRPITIIHSIKIREYSSLCGNRCFVSIRGSWSTLHQWPHSVSKQHYILTVLASKWWGITIPTTSSLQKCSRRLRVSYQLKASMKTSDLIQYAHWWTVSLENPTIKLLNTFPKFLLTNHVHHNNWLKNAKI